MHFDYEVDVTVTVELGEIIERDEDGFNDLLDDLTRDYVDARVDNAVVGRLSDITWDVVKLGSEPNTLELRVRGVRHVEE